MLCDLPFVHTVKTPKGTERHYYRRKGYRRIRLPGEPGSAGFLAAYKEASEGDARVAPSVTEAPGSFGALCVAYLGSADFGQLSPITRRELRYMIERLRKAHGARGVAALKREHVLGWRDAIQATPGAANTMIRTVRILMTFAVDRGWRKDNPCLGIKMLKTGHFRAWTDAEQSAFEARWLLGSVQRTIYALALYTGQRRADVAKMRWLDIAGDAIHIVQNKTGAVLKIPMHRNLRDALAAAQPRCEAAIAVSEKGRAYGPVQLGHLMAEAIDAAGLPKDCVMHGLRKSATKALIDAGCTPHQAGAITGHKTVRMIEEYARDRDQKKLAKDAIVKWDRAAKRRGGTK